MKKKIFKFISLCFIVGLMVSLFAGCGEEEEVLSKEEKIIQNSSFIKPSQNDDFKYKIYEDYIAITSYIGGQTSVTVPKEIEDKPVYVVEDEAFAGNDVVKDITIDNNVRKVGESCFESCSELISVKMSENVKEIPASCFADCAQLKEFEFSKTVNVIGNSAFNDCTGLTEIIIPGNVETIDSYAFSGCGNVKTVTIIDGYTNNKDDDGNYIGIEKTIGDGAFSSLVMCENIIVGKNVKELEESVFSYAGHDLGEDQKIDGQKKPETMFYGYAPSTICTYCATNRLKFTEIKENDEFDKILQVNYPKSDSKK